METRNLIEVTHDLNNILLGLPTSTSDVDVGIELHLETAISHIWDALCEANDVPKDYDAKRAFLKDLGFKCKPPKILGTIKSDTD